MKSRPLLTHLLSLLLICVLVVPAIVGAQTSAPATTAIPDTTIPDALWAVVNGFFGTLVAIAGLFLDFAVTEFVVNFGFNYINSGIGGQVDTLWVTVRDLFNITFIFGLVYIGFRMILDSDNSQTRRGLVYLIIAALLVNFSLFFTKFIIDISNQLATQIALPMTVNGISTLFNNAMGITTIWQTNASNSGTLFNAMSAGAAYGYIFGAMLIFLIATFVFASGAFMLLIRYIVLHIYLVLSPFMFIGFVFPQLMSTTRKYWSGFLGRVFYAPIYLLLLFFAASILTGSQGNVSAQSNPNLAAVWGTGGGTLAVGQFVATIPPFLLAAGFMVAAVVVSKHLGADGAQTAINIGNNIRGRAQRRLRDTGYWAARNAERAATSVPRAIGRETANISGNLINTGLDRAQRSQNRIVRGVAGNLVIDESVRGAASKLKGTKAGFKYTADERDKKQTKIRSEQEAWQAVQAGVEASNEQYNTVDGDKIYDPKTGRIVEKSMLNATDLAMAEKAQADREKAKAEMLEKLRDLKTTDLEQLYRTDAALFTSIIGQLDDAAVGKLLESDNLNSAEIKDIAGKRIEKLQATYTENGIKVASEFAKLSIKQIELMGDEFIRENAELFTQDQWDAIKKSDKFTQTQKDTYKASRKTNIKTVLATAGKSPDVGSLIYNNTGTVQTTSASGKQRWIKRLKQDKDGNPVYRKASEIASLPLNALTDPRIIGELPVDAIKQIGRDHAAGKSHLSSQEIDNLHEALARDGSTAVKNYLTTPRAMRDFKDQR